MILIIAFAIVLYVCFLLGILALCRVSSKADNHHEQILQQYKAERERLIQ